MGRETTHPQLGTEALIIGGGAAGLYAGLRLQQADVTFTILEADNHAGGRVFSRPEKNSDLGLVLDEGANLINSTDTLAIGLMNRFNISYVRRLKPGADSMHYLVDGQEYDQRAFDNLIFQDSREAINSITLDQDTWRASEDRDVDPRFINESIANYLHRIGAGPTLRVMLKSFFWSEYGHDITNLNLHVLFDYLEIGQSGPHFQLIPNADEAFTVPEGTGQIIDAMEALCHDKVQYGQRVTAISEGGGVITVRAKSADGVEQVHTTGHVFFAAPLHSLKKIAVNVRGVSQAAVSAAGNSSYANGSKLHLKFLEGFDSLYRFSGILLTDTGEQIWPSGTGQSGAGLLTVLTGPLPAGRAAAVEQAGHILKALDRICPGLSELFVSVERTDAPMSYSGSLHPGESAQLEINNGGVNWTTIGEANGEELKGYLEGALRSADVGTARFLQKRRMLRKNRK